MVCAQKSVSVLAVAILSVLVTACSTVREVVPTPQPGMAPCIVVVEIKSVLGSITPLGLAIGPSVQRLIMFSEDCDGRAVVRSNSIEVEKVE